MKKLWVKVIPWKKEIITTALESGADAVWVEEGMSEKVKELGRKERDTELKPFIMAVKQYIYNMGRDDEAFEEMEKQIDELKL